MIQLPERLRSTKAKLIVGLSALALIAIVAFALVTIGDSPSDETSRGQDQESNAQPNEQASDAIQPGTPQADATATPGVTESPVAQDEADPNATADPVSQSFRSPVRCSQEGTPKTGSIPGEDANNGKRWVTVQSLSGACDLSSSQFTLRGIDTRIAWRSDASNFNAFLIDTDDPDAAAGFADADCSGPCSEYQSLTNKSADYTLRVQADGGPWEVFVQEYR